MNSAYQVPSHISKHLAQGGKNNDRDHVLDFAKGIAIILVVFGHTLQGQSENFDEIFGFRLIYSFHMPLFAFLSGAAAAHWIEKFNSGGNLFELTNATISRIRRSTVQLLLPFLSWTIIGFWAGNQQGPLTDYLWKVFKNADYSLWFLPCVFWCTTFTVLFMLCTSIIRNNLEGSRFGKIFGYLKPLPVQMAILLLIWLVVRRILPTEFGLVFANWFHGGLFIYFLLGVVFFKKFVGLSNKATRIFPYVIFLALAPFWHRTMPYKLIQDAPDFLVSGWLASVYAPIVAICGTLAIIDIARWISSFNIKPINIMICYLGAASLGVYAMHFYFLAYKPQVVSALLISLLLYQLISFVPVARTMLLGK